jgi:hypothetical protein
MPFTVDRSRPAAFNLHDKKKNIEEEESVREKVE